MPRLGVHVPDNPIPVSDDFNAGVLDAGMWITIYSSDASRVTVASSQLQITHTTTAQYNEATSYQTYDLTATNTSVQVVDAGNQSLTTHQVLFGVRLDANNKVFMAVGGNSLQSYKLVGGVQTFISSIAYDSTAHAFWRIREASGTTFFDTSPDRFAWTNRFSVANPFALTAIQTYCQSGCYGTEASTSYGYFDNYYAPVNTSDLQGFINNAGHTVDIVNIFQSWGNTDGTQNFVPSWMNAIVASGATPMITWEPWVYSGGTTQGTYQLIDIISGNFDTYISTFAAACAAWGKPIYLRLAHEMNGNWYPWAESANGNSAGQYITMWLHVKALFAAATNVSWVWCPYINFSGSPAISGFYPGDSYVDILGIDGYNWGTDGGNVWTTFTNVFSSAYADINAVNSTKPLFICETGCSENGGTKSAWIKDMWTSSIYSFPRIQTVCWFNESTTGDVRIETSAASKEAFKQAIKYWFTKDEIGNKGRTVSVASGMSRAEVAN